ncbi:MAG: hypothetical protein IT445_20330 [Phycisphaeraceae bacterium]|nr:hypothetical protein [Phycisphaeraceae bacterium]
MAKTFSSWIGRFLGTIALLTMAGLVQADTRYYHIRTQYGWQLKATEDASGFDVVDDQVPLQQFPRRMGSPLDLTALLKIDDMNVPGRKVRLTCYFQSLGYTDEIHQWVINDFSDRAAIRKQVRDFITQNRHLNSIPIIAAYEEEAIACLLLSVHQQSVVIDLDVPPDMPDPLVYQADALIYDAAIGPDQTPSPREHGIAWFESDQQVEELQQAVLASGVQRVERLRHLLWGHLKLLALFVENHQYDYFYPRTLSTDAPTLMATTNYPPNIRFTMRELSQYTRQAMLNKITPAYAFPAIYRWASMSMDDFASTIGQANWQQVQIDPNVQFASTADEARGARRAESAVERLELTREQLRDLHDTLMTYPDDELINPLALITRQQELGQRYLQTLTRIHKASSGNTNTAITADHAWTAQLPIMSDKNALYNQHFIVKFNQNVDQNNTPPSIFDQPYFGPYGLWLASLDQARFIVDQNLKQADIHRINERSMVVTSHIEEAPLFVPGLASDHSPSRLAMVDVDSKTMLEARRLTLLEAQAYLPADEATSENAPPGNP